MAYWFYNHQITLLCQNKYRPLFPTNQRAANFHITFNPISKQQKGFSNGNGLAYMAHLLAH